MKVLPALALVAFGIWAMLHGLTATGCILALVGAAAVGRNY